MNGADRARLLQVRALLFPPRLPSGGGRRHNSPVGSRCEMCDHHQDASDAAARRIEGYREGKPVPDASEGLQASRSRACSGARVLAPVRRVSGVWSHQRVPRLAVISARAAAGGGSQPRHAACADMTAPGVVCL